MTVGRVRNLLCVLVVFLPSLLFAQLAERADFGVLAGASKIPDTNLPSFNLPVVGTPVTSSVTTYGAFTVQGSFSWRVLNVGPTSFSLELPLTIVPTEHSQTLAVHAPGVPGIVPDLVLPTFGNGPSYFFTPGVRWQILGRRVAPYLAGGVGIEHATFQASTVTCVPGNCFTTNQIASTATKGAFDVGGGADIRLFRSIAYRTEIRDYLRMGRAIAESRQNLVFLSGVAVHF